MSNTQANTSMLKSVYTGEASVRIVSTIILIAVMCLLAGMPPGVLTVLILSGVIGWLAFYNIRRGISLGRVEIDEVDASAADDRQDDCDPEDVADGEQTADSFMFSQLKEMGLRPVRDADTIIFHYQGGCFRAQWLDKHVIRISFPCLMSVDVGCQNHLCRLLNMINSSYVLVKMTMAPSDGECVLLVHGSADIYYTSANCDTEDYLTDVLDIFFSARNALFDGLRAISGMEDVEETPEISDAGSYYGFSLN